MACEKLPSNLGFLPHWLCSAQWAALTWVMGQTGPWEPYRVLTILDSSPATGASLCRCNGDTGGIHRMCQWGGGVCLSVSSLPKAGRGQEARGCTCVSACVQQDTCAHLCVVRCGVKGKAPSFPLGKSLLLVVLSLLLLAEATGWSPLAWCCSHDPPRPPARSL